MRRISFASVTKACAGAAAFFFGSFAEASSALMNASAFFGSVIFTFAKILYVAISAPPCMLLQRMFS